MKSPRLYWHQALFWYAVLAGSLISFPVVLALVSAHPLPAHPLPAQPLPPQAEAPAQVIARTVEDLAVGMQSAVVPEALVIGEDRKVWLHKHQPLSTEVTGLVVHHLKDGSFEVEVKDEKLRWLKVPITEEIKKALVPVRALHLSFPKSKDSP